ncbi:MAG TPA: TorF family putative porin [Cellvibrionaceae bacterium]|nr:TorF family putative porin [Cellvibrionaceae bacterium]
MLVRISLLSPHFYVEFTASGQMVSVFGRVGLLPAKEFLHQAHNNLKEAWHLRISFSDDFAITLEETSMKFTKSLLSTAVAALASASLFAPVANAEVSGSVGVANMYYWRGLDLGTGDPQVSGDLKFSESGFYAGIWGGSGDSVGGTEYDLYIGYGNTIGDIFKYDFSLWTYSYPSAPETSTSTSYKVVGSNVVAEDVVTPLDPFNTPGELSEAVLTLGVGPVSLTYMDNIAGGTGYWYSTISATFDKFTILYGLHETDLAHVDLSYAYNDRLSFKIGKVVDDVDGTFDDDVKFIASYSLPIGD